MKKLVALLLSAVLALSACAFAEEAAPVTHSHKLSNVYIVAGDQIIDLTDLSLELDVSGEDKPDAARVHLDTADGTVAEAGITMVDNTYFLHFVSDSLGHVDYAIDPVVLVSRFLDQGVNGIVALLQSLNTSEMARGLLSVLGLIDAAPAEPAPAEEPAVVTVPEIDLSKISFDGNPIEVLMGCVSAPETADMGGVEYAPDGSEIVIADGTYTTRTFDLDTEALCTLLDMVCLDGEPSGLGDVLRESGVSIELHATFQSGEAEGLNQMASVTLTIDGGQAMQSMTLDVNTFYGADGETTAVTYGQTTGTQTDAQPLGVSFYLTKGQHEGEAFTSDSVDAASAVSLTEMETPEIIDTLGIALVNVGGEALGVITNALMESMLAGVDLSALQAELDEAAAAE